MTHEFTTFSPPPHMEAYPHVASNTVKKHADTARSADLLFPVKYARVGNNKEVRFSLMCIIFTCLKKE